MLLLPDPHPAFGPHLPSLYNQGEREGVAPRPIFRLQDYLSGVNLLHILDTDKGRTLFGYGLCIPAPSADGSGPGKSNSRYRQARRS
jgi:hypothetical protein